MQTPELGTYEGHVIKVNDGMINLTNMWKACGGDETQRPSAWMRSIDARKIMVALEEKMESKCVKFTHLTEVKMGRHGGTFAHPVIGLAYAKYLSPEFHIWCNEKLLESGLIEVGGGEFLVKLGGDGLPVEQSGSTHKKRPLRSQSFGALTPPDRDRRASESFMVQRSQRRF